MGARSGLVVLAPIAPAPTGNGLAMRTELFHRAASFEPDACTVVVPVAGRLPIGAPASPHFAVAPRGDSKAEALRLVADPVWRERLTRAGTLPPHFLSPAVAGTVAEAVDGQPRGLHVMRSYLAPVGVALAELLGVAWVTLDLDEDDTVLASPEEAAAHDRLLATFGPLFDGLSAASNLEGEAIGRRHGLDVTHLPNAVDVPAQPVRPSRSTRSLLFVGNMTYRPNLQAARRLVREILPALRQPARVVLVGPNDRRTEALAGEHVEVAGYVPDLTDIYATADVAVVPLLSGAGTRIKILEAFAHRVPVVATPVAAAGLDCDSGHHLLLADDVTGLAAAVDRLLADDALAGRLADAAYDLVGRKYSTDVVVPAIRAFFARAEGRRQPA